jgi:Protein of unknown function (DUF3616)
MVNNTRLAAAIAVATVLAATPLMSGSAGAKLKQGSAIKVIGNFAKQGENLGKPSKQISGLACAPATGSGVRTCLAIDDEGRNAQFFTFDGTEMKPAEELTTLIDDDTETTALGKPPKVTECTKVAFSDLDGEGVAYAASYFYVVGSHGCGRKHGTFSASSFVTARIAVGGGAPSADGQYPVKTTFRLADALAKVDPESFGQKLGNEKLPQADGMNVEGVAVVGDMLYAGLRAPSRGGKNLIVGVALSELFADGHDRYKGTPKVVELSLGKNTGIRDLAVLPDERLLILAGPTREEEAVPYRLHAVDPANSATLTSLGRIKGFPDGAKAEGVLPLGTPDKLSFVIVFDGVKNGGPTKYKLVPGE